MIGNTAMICRKCSIDKCKIIDAVYYQTIILLTLGISDTRLLSIQSEPRCLQSS